MDRRLIAVILKDFYTKDIFKPDYKFSKSGIYYAPEESDITNYFDYINSLPIYDNAEVFGMHSNAEISSNIIETNAICDTILNLLPRSAGGGGESEEDIMKRKCGEMLERLPP